MATRRPSSNYQLTGLHDRVAVVTGAGRMRSIGRSVAIELARAGCDVAITGTGRQPDRYPDEEKAAGWKDIDSVAEEVRSLGRRALPIVTDVSDLHAVEEAAEQITRELGTPYVVVNSASFPLEPNRVTLPELDPLEWSQILNVNLSGTFFMCKVFGAAMIAAGQGGSIVNISSLAAKTFPPKRAAYAASKAGVNALTVSMAKDVANYGIRVNAICPGLIDTERTIALMKEPAGVRSTIPLGRAGTGNDVAYVVVFLCSDQGAWITGQLENVDGGLSHV
jgi:3-oxoacyl-[acyl-carrier protein] reductase